MPRETVKSGWLSRWFWRIALIAVFLYMLVDTIANGQLWTNILALILVVLAYREGRQDENIRIHSLSSGEFEKEREKRKAEGAALLARLGQARK